MPWTARASGHPGACMHAAKTTAPLATVFIIALCLPGQWLKCEEGKSAERVGASALLRDREARSFSFSLFLSCRLHIFRHPFLQGSLEEQPHARYPYHRAAAAAATARLLHVSDCARRQHNLYCMRVRAPCATSRGRRASVGRQADARLFAGASCAQSTHTGHARVGRGAGRVACRRALARDATVTWRQYSARVRPVCSPLEHKEPAHVAGGVSLRRARSWHSWYSSQSLWNAGPSTNR